MKKLLYLVLVLFIVGAIVSCNESPVDNSIKSLSIDKSFSVNTFKDVAGNDVCGMVEYTLWAGQNIDAGTLTVSNYNETLYVTYTASQGTFGTLHLWVGSKLEELPVNPQGIPVPGQFPYQFDATGKTSYTFEISFDELKVGCNNNVYIVAHAEMYLNEGDEDSETAFGGNLSGNAPRWYFYADYTIVCCDNPYVPVGELGTAFGKGTHVFTTGKQSNPENLPTIGLTKNRWGWAINMTETGSYDFELWVGAGLNKTENGLKVGEGTIDFNGSEATISYTLYSGYSVKETHIYAGDFVPATLAPGQYGNIDYFYPYATDYELNVELSDTDGDGVWFIIHAVAFGEELPDDGV